MNLARITKASSSIRHLHSSTSACMPRRMVGIPPPKILQETGMLLEENDIPEWDDTNDDAAGNEGTAAGHLYLRQQRNVLKYMRLIEHDMPRLVPWRIPFTPPSKEHPLIVRTLDYGGEGHPAIAKRVVVVPVSQLPLKTAEAIHTFKLLAGPRWSTSPPSDSGVGINEEGDEQGYIKISCENYPNPGMNLKWISDVLDKLVEEANNAGVKYAKVPLDDRHLVAKHRKAGKTRNGHRSSLRDFPQDWLPNPSQQSENSAKS